MNELLEKIKADLTNGQSVALIGPGGSGKSWFVVNELIPSLNKDGYKTKYIKECDDDFDIGQEIDFVFFDEVETFIDREFLEKRHPEESPYYEESYIKQVKDWHKKLKEIRNPSLYIITRNDPEDIKNLADTLSVTDWGVGVKAYVFGK